MVSRQVQPFFREKAAENQTKYDHEERRNSPFSLIAKLNLKFKREFKMSRVPLFQS